jgi:hypothetical protein
MSLIRFVADSNMNLYLVTAMHTREDKPTNEPAFATTLVVKFREGDYRVLSTEDVIIHTLQ